MRTLIMITLVGSLLSASAEAKKTETFVVRPANYIAATVASGSFIAAFPAGIPHLDEPAISNGLLVAAKVESAQGAVIGFATEQASLDFVNLVSTCTWTVTIPGRGTLFLSQQETLAPLVQIISDMIAGAELERSYDPPFTLTTTVTGTGVVIGGTGEFAHAKGTFREVDELHHISLVTGALEVTDTLIVELSGAGGGDEQ